MVSCATQGFLNALVMTYLLAGLLTFPITAALTIAGVGAAFILIPVFISLGIDIRQAMAIALLLNALAMLSASIRYARNGLILWKIGVPLIVTSSIGAPIGVSLGYSIDTDVIRIVFICFLVFAASMFLFSRRTTGEAEDNPHIPIVKSVVGGFAGLGVGLLAGLIGVGGGNIVLPVLIALGIAPRKAVGTTALIVVFSSLAGFLSHVGVGHLDPLLIVITAGASIAGAVLGSWLMTDKLNPVTIKKILALVLIGVAIKMTINLI